MFGDEGGVDVDDPSAPRLDPTGSLFEEDSAWGIPPGRVGVGEEMANIDLANRPEDGIGDGVKQGVGVRVTVQAFAVRNLDAPQDQLAVGD